MAMLSSSNKKYEKLMDEIGGFGPFQKKLFFLMALSSVPNGYFALSMVFIGRTPTFECVLPTSLNVGNATSSMGLVPENSSLDNETSTFATFTENFSLSPSNVSSTQDNCALSKNFTNNGTITTNNNRSCPYGYVYGFEEGRSSIVTEWELICDRAWIMPLITSIYMGGVLVGSFLGGSLSDRFGRKPTFLFGTVFMFLFLGLCGLATSPAMLAAFLFVAGATGFINYLTAFTISAEIINSKDRVITGTLTVGGFAIGYMLLPVFAYYIGNWRTLCLVLASLGVVFIPYFWLISESPRWLFSKGRREEFIALFMKIAETNGVSKVKAETLLREFFSANVPAQEMKMLSGEKDKDETFNDHPSMHAESFTYIDLVRTSRVRCRSLAMWFTWFVCSVVYYCVALNTSNMGGNPFINCFVAAAVEIPAYAMVIVLLKWRGRKPILISSLLVAGLSCSSVPYLKQINAYLSIAFAMIGKLSISGAFGIVFIVCSELFPTLMRSMGVGSSSMAARVGGMVAPYILYLGNTYESAPYLIMGLLAAFASVLNAFLPETRDSAMPEKIEDLEPIKVVSCMRIGKFKNSKWNIAVC